MSYRYESYAPARRRSGLRGCLLALVIVVWLVVLGFVAVRYWVRPRLTGWIEDQVARTIDPQLPQNLPSEDALRRSLEQLPVAPELPSGELRISEADAGAYLSEYSSRLPGIDDIAVRFVPGEVQATISAGGLQSTVRLQPAVRDGRIVADAELGQPLGSLISIDGLMSALTDRINGDLQAQGKRITGITIDDGVAIVAIE